MKKEDIIRQLREHKNELQKRFPLKSIALFGSYARDEATAYSDVDILVEFSSPVGFEIVDLTEELERILNHKVDIVSKKGLKPYYRSHVEKDAIYV